MQQIAEYALWFLLGAIGFAGIYLFIEELRESKRLLEESKARHPVYDYSNLDHLDGLGEET